MIPMQDNTIILPMNPIIIRTFVEFNIVCFSFYKYRIFFKLIKTF
jgi:hypothetical protein